MSLHSTRGYITVRWTSNVIIKDVAGFYIIVRNADSKILLEHHLSYEYRVDQITGSDICDGQNCGNLEMCVLSKNSNGTINGWFDAQCIYLPNDLPKIMRKYTQNNGQVHYVHSVAKRVKANTVATSHQEAVTATTCAVLATAIFVAIRSAFV